MPSFHATCGPDHHYTCARCGLDLGRNFFAIWVITAVHRCDSYKMCLSLNGYKVSLLTLFFTHRYLSLCSAGQKISAVTGYSGGNIIINYKYEMKYKNHEKYVCKTGADQCLINTNRAAKWKHVGRFSVHDDRSARLLRVFIRELNVNDSGEYKIIVKVSEYYSFFSEFHLNIRDGELLSFTHAFVSVVN